VNLYSRAFRPGSAVGSPARTVSVKLANRVLRRFPQSRPRVRYELGGFELEIPLSHPLPRILATDEHYLAPLTAVARAVSAAGVEGPAIDIGANVGDTAILMAQAGLRHVVCVEGNDIFLGPLRANAARADSLDWNFDIVDKFLGSPDEGEGLHVSTKGGTAALVRAGTVDDQLGSSRFISPTELLASHPSVSLLKIDTDGMDLRILAQVLQARADTSIESVFVEYSPGLEAVNEAFELLSEAGLGQLFWFDHSGHLVCSSSSDDAGLVAELAHYGRSRGLYFDIAAVRPDSAVAAALAVRPEGGVYGRP
jgi:FkbM family methyltransferase